MCICIHTYIHMYLYTNIYIHIIYIRLFTAELSHFAQMRGRPLILRQPLAAHFVLRGLHSARLHTVLPPSCGGRHGVCS